MLHVTEHVHSRLLPNIEDFIGHIAADHEEPRIR
jgi:hypothetical protein